MSWGITIKNVDLLGVRKDELESKLTENESMIQYHKEQLIAIAVYTLPTVIEGDSEPVSLIDYSVMRINEIVDSLRELCIENNLIQIALDNIDDVEEFD